MRRLLLALCLLFAVPAMSGGGRRYILLHTDEATLVLQDRFGRIHVADAMTYCWEHQGFLPGTVVVSTEDLDLCVMTTLVSTFGETCDVWCP